MARTMRAALAAALLVLVALANVPVASADAASGVAYLASTQDTFGGWDGDPLTSNEFTTTEAILAIAEAAQTGSTWSTTQAFDAVDQFDDDVSGDSPLDYMNAAANNQMIPPGKAAKWIVNVAAPLGIDPTSFFGVDLVALMGPPGVDGSFGTGNNFNGAAYAALASYLLDGSVPPQTVTYLLSAQNANGGWGFEPDPTSDPETDSTALTIEALIAGGVSPTDSAIQAALPYLARDVTPEQFDLDAGYQNATGIWWSFGGPGPESTSRAILGLTAAGYDTDSPCWRDTGRPELSGTAYTPSLDSLAGLQGGDGSWGFPPFNSFTTAQAIQGLEVSTWRPIVIGAAQTCEVSVSPAPTTPLTPTPVVVEPTFTG